MSSLSGISQPTPPSPFPSHALETAEDLADDIPGLSNDAEASRTASLAEPQVPLTPSSLLMLLV